MLPWRGIGMHRGNPLTSALAPLAGSGPAAAGAVIPAARALSGRQKAAIIVRLLVSEGAQLQLRDLPDDLQSALTEEIAAMRAVDRVTLRAVVEEFCGLIDSLGLGLGGGLDDALKLLDGQLSDSAAARLRQRAGSGVAPDPWERIAAVDADRLLPILDSESVEVGAVILSKLAVPKAADLLGRIPGDRARRLAYAVSLTSAVDPETVHRIGQALVSQLDAVVPVAFDTGPVERVGAILNFSPAATRDDVLTGLDETDASFAGQVRKAIFTFTHIPERIDPRDIPKIVRGVDQPILVTALAAAKGADAATVDFILANISQRLAGSLRDEIEAAGTVKDKDGEAAQGAVVMAIRTLEAAGDLALVTGEEA